MVADTKHHGGPDMAVHHYPRDHYAGWDEWLESSQPRQPCWKLEHRFGRKDMVKRILREHNCGWYYRVIEEGEAQAGDAIRRVETGHEGWSVARLFACLYDPSQTATAAELQEIAALDRLCDEWRKKAAKAIAG